METLQMLQAVISQISPNPKERRSIVEFDKCLYYPHKDKPESKGCAIGMFLKPKNAKTLDKQVDTSIKSVICKSQYFPEWMLKMPIEFLVDIQRLHDIDDNWNKDTGLNEHGMWRIKNICKRHSIDFNQLKF